MKYLPSLSPLADNFDALLLDLWGCVHDGSQLYPGARDCIDHAHAAGKRIIFLSNAPRRASRAQAVLDKLGVPRHLYEAVVTSGEVAYLQLSSASSVIRHASSYFYIGQDNDAGVLEGLPYHDVMAIAQADFLLNTGFGTEEGNDVIPHTLLREAVQHRLPMLCLNPDLEVVKLTGERAMCAGAIAVEYEKLDGKVHYFGKPYGQVYDHCIRLLAPLTKDRVLAIGDSLHTDILGANRAGIASALVTGGILKATLGEQSPEEIIDWLASQQVRPEFVLPGLIW